MLPSTTCNIGFQFFRLSSSDPFPTHKKHGAFLQYMDNMPSLLSCTLLHSAVGNLFLRIVLEVGFGCLQSYANIRLVCVSYATTARIKAESIPMTTITTARESHLQF